MNAERSRNYTLLMDFLRETGSVKLQPIEQDRVRAAADELIFAATWDEQAERALDDVDALAEHLVDSGRWEPEAAERLVDHLRGLGPDPVAAGLSY